MLKDLSRWSSTFLSRWRCCWAFLYTQSTCGPKDRQVFISIPKYLKLSTCSMLRPRICRGSHRSGFFLEATAELLSLWYWAVVSPQQMFGPGCGLPVGIVLGLGCWCCVPLRPCHLHIWIVWVPLCCWTHRVGLTLFKWAEGEWRDFKERSGEPSCLLSASGCFSVRRWEFSDWFTHLMPTTLFHF